MRMIVFSLMLVASTVVGADKDGWVSLFDGKTLDGWVQKNGTATYRVENGTIIGKTAEGSPNSLLCTVKEYGDFEFEAEVKCADQLNSGFQIRSKTKPAQKEEKSAAADQPDKKAKKKRARNEEAGRVYGPQVEIEASGENGAEAGYVYGEATGLGWLTPPERLKPHKHFKDGQWNQFRIVAQGPRIQTWINGIAIEDLVHEEIYKSFPSGFISLQVHGIGERQGPFEVAWRNIRIRELPPAK
jgi:hypothetical protein